MPGIEEHTCDMIVAVRKDSASDAVLPFPSLWRCSCRVSSIAAGGTCFLILLRDGRVLGNIPVDRKIPSVTPSDPKERCRWTPRIVRGLPHGEAATRVWCGVSSFAIATRSKRLFMGVCGESPLVPAREGTACEDSRCKGSELPEREGTGDVVEITSFAGKTIVDMAFSSTVAVCVVQTSTSSTVVLSWGHSPVGLLGLGEDVHYQETPTEIPTLSPHRVVQVSGSMSHFCARTYVGHVFEWGQLACSPGQERGEELVFEPRQPIRGNVFIKSVACGVFRSAACTAQGQLLEWGRVKAGRSDFQAFSRAPLHSPLGHKVKSVHSGGRHFAAVTGNGIVISWGLDACRLSNRAETGEAKQFSAVSAFRADAVALGADIVLALVGSGLSSAQVATSVFGAVQLHSRTPWRTSAHERAVTPPQRVTVKRERQWVPPSITAESTETSSLSTILPNPITQPSNAHDMFPWLMSHVKTHRVTVLVFFRGAWCPFDEHYLRCWKSYAQAISEMGGSVLALSSQSLESLESCRKRWRLRYGVVSDCGLSLCSHFGVHATENARNHDGYDGANNMISQPAVFVLSRTKEELYSWTQVPSQYNLDGASNRPKPEDLVELVVQRHLEGKKAHPSFVSHGFLNKAKGERNVPARYRQKEIVDSYLLRHGGDLKSWLQEELAKHQLTICVVFPNTSEACEAWLRRWNRLCAEVKLMQCEIIGISSVPQEDLNALPLSWKLDFGLVGGSQVLQWASQNALRFSKKGGELTQGVVILMSDANELYTWQASKLPQNRGKDTFVDPYDVWKCALDVLENKVSLDLLLGPSKQRKTGQMYKTGRISCGDPTNLNGYRTKESDGRERARLARKQLNLTDNSAV